MIWQNTEDPFKEKIEQSSYDFQLKRIAMEEEDKDAVQLKKFQDPANDVQRQAHKALISQFNDLLVNNNIDEIINTKLTDNCEFFLFSTTERAPVRYVLRPEELHDLYKGIKIQKKKVGEIHVDVEKSTVIQLSHCEILYEDDETPINEIVFEIFSIKDNRISKYRASFARKGIIKYGELDPFESSRKDKILYKLKEINYALAGEPNLEKVASFFSETAQYKVWSWETQKSFTFGKHDFARNFRTLGENLVLKRIVPYEVYTDSDLTFGTYIYHLEGTGGKYANQKFIWASTCVYSFDEDFNALKICQQGELHLESEARISFEVYSRERIEKTLKSITNSSQPGMDMFYNDVIDLTCPVYRYASECLSGSLFFRFVGEHEQSLLKLAQNSRQNIVESKDLVDFYFDSNSSGYDVSINITCFREIINIPGHKYDNLALNTIQFSRACFEKGKIVKILILVSELPEPIPSPFDDHVFQSLNIMPRNN